MNPGIYISYQDKIDYFKDIPDYMDNEDSKLYCENCYENKLAGKGNVLTFITHSLKDYEKILRQIKRVIKLKKEEERIKKSLDYYRIKLAEYVLQTGAKGGGFSYGMHSKINEEINISASPLFLWSKEIDERTSVHVYNKKTNENFSIYSGKD